MEKPKTLLSEKKLALMDSRFFNARTAMEFGAGGSTVRALECGIKRLYSIETDKGWIEHLKSVPLCAQAIEDRRLKLFHGDIGPTKIHGHPADTSRIKAWPDYWQSMWRRLEKQNKIKSLESILVDGRFRVATVLYSALKMSGQTVIYFDDFLDRKERYGDVLKYFKVVGEADTLVALKRRWGIDRSALALDIIKYAHTPD